MILLQQLNVLNRTLVIGRRWNIPWKNVTLYLPEHVTQIAKKRGRLHMLSAIDYFIIAKNQFPWLRVPDVVIARRGYDNYLVMTAIKTSISVVDVTNTLFAVHQTDSEARDRRRHSKDHEYNMRSLGRFNYHVGIVSNSQFLTNSVTDTLRNTTTIVVVRRPPKEVKAARTINTHQRW